MKRLHLFLFVAALSCFVMGCRKPVEVSFGVDSKTIAAEGGSCTVALKSNGDWTVSTTAEWFTVSPTSGNGDATLTIEVQPNTSDQVRSQEIIASTKDNTASLSIEQEGTDKYITLMPSSMLGDWEGGSFQVIVHANIAWTVTTLPEWVECSKLEGNGDDTLWMTMNPFLEPGHREADVTFGDENIYAQFHVKQTGTTEVQHFLNVTPNELHVANTGESITLFVSCDETWTTLLDGEWISLDKTEGEGNDIVVVTVAENPLYGARNTAIKFVSNSGLIVVVDIAQEASVDPHFLEVTPSTLYFGHEGGSQDVAIGCDVDWSVLFFDEWLSVSTMEGTGNGSVTITVEPNVLHETRVAALNVTSGNLSQRILVRQTPGEELLWAAVNPDSLFAPQPGAALSFAVTSNTDWVLSAPSWIVLPQTYGSGDASIDMMVGANIAYSSRIGHVSVMHNGSELAHVVVVQEGVTPTLTADVEEIVFTREGGTQSFNLTANTSWTITNTATDWLYCEPLTGNGDSVVLLKADPMTGTQERETVLVIRGSMGQVINVTVRQTN